MATYPRTLAQAATTDLSGTYATKLGARWGDASARARAARLGSAVLADPPTLSIASNPYSASTGQNFTTPLTVSGQIASFTPYAGWLNPAGNSAGLVRVRRTFPQVVTAASTTWIDSGINQGVASPNMWSYEIGHYGRKISFKVRAYGTPGTYRVKVNNQYVSLTPSTTSTTNDLIVDFTKTYTITGVTTANPGVVTTSAAHGLKTGDIVDIASVGGATQANGRWPVTVLSSTTFSIATNVTGTYTSGGSVLAGYAARVIEVELFLMQLQGFTIGATDYTWIPDRPRSPRLLVVGDSFAYGSFATDGIFSGMVTTLATTLGIDDVYLDTLGGTGYLKTNGANPNFLTRIGTNLAACDPDMVLFLGSVNDDTFTQEQVRAQAASVFAACGATPVMAAYMASLQPTPLGQAGAVAGLVAAGAAATNCLGVLDLTTVLTGTGRQGSVTGSGNSDVMRHSDGTHPAQPAHDIYGNMIAKWMQSIIPGLS